MTSRRRVDRATSVFYLMELSRTLVEGASKSKSKRMRNGSRGDEIAMGILKKS